MTKNYIGEYDIVDFIALGFLTHNDSFDMVIRKGEGYIHFDGADIYYINNANVRRQSHTVNYAIKIWLEQGHIKLREEIPT